MANILEKYYSSFGGVDSRSNKLLQDPKTMRKGSKNFRYNFQDEIQKANGFQHYSTDHNAAQYGMMEYKYVDVNTGEAKTEILGIGSDGFLYRRKKSTLTFTAHGAATSVSVYYDESADKFKVAMNGLGTVTITSLSMTLAQLETALEALTGVAITITGETYPPAYLLGCVIEDAAFSDNFVSYWEKVPFSLPMNSSSAPFSSAAFADSRFEGPSYVNLNNSIYITIGQFVMKYDGASVYRAGMPGTVGSSTASLSSLDGFALLASTGAGSLTTLSTYKYKFQTFYVDNNGVTILGNVQNGVQSTLAGTENTITIAVPPVRRSNNFPVYACKINQAGGLDLNSGALTFNVDSGHNILAGMTIRIPVTNASLSSNGQSYMYCLVASVTSTSITLSAIPKNNLDSYYGSTTVIDNTWLNAGYCETYFNNSMTNVVEGTNYIPTVNVGAGVRVYRTTANGDTYYRLVDLPLHYYDNSVSPNDKYSFIDTIADINQSRVELDELTDNTEPRACKYISSWQGQLVQAGRPLLESTILTTYKPMNYTGDVQNAWSLSDKNNTDVYYTEADLCDYQSFYWSDSASTEGFPRSGLNEQRVDTDYNDNITGIAPNKEAFFAFKERTTSVHTGTLATGDIVSEILEGSVGCSAHRSIQDVLGSLVWLDKRNGFFSCVAGRLPVNIGFPISDYQKINEDKLNYTTACAATFVSESLYVCGVGTTSFIFDFARIDDSARNCWYIWDRLNCKSILATADDELLISDDDYVWKMKRTNTKYDFTDHTSAIDMHLKTAWLSQGAPTIDKHFIAFWFNSIQGDFTLDVEQYGNFLSDMISSLTVSFMAESSLKKFVKAGVKAAMPKLSSISIGMRNQQKNKFVRLQGWELEYSADFDAGEPKR